MSPARVESNGKESLLNSDQYINRSVCVEMLDDGFSFRRVGSAGCFRFSETGSSFVGKRYCRVSIERWMKRENIQIVGGKLILPDGSKYSPLSSAHLPITRVS